MLARLGTLLSLTLVAVTLGCGPFLLLPGGKLEGRTAAAPSDWSFAEEVNTVQLETNSADPYSVNIWAVGLGPDVYVHAGGNRSTWVENMEADPAVRLQIEESVYELAAARVTAQEEFDHFSNAYEQKYGSRPRNEKVKEAYLFRLSPR